MTVLLDNSKLLTYELRTNTRGSSMAESANSFVDYFVHMSYLLIQPLNEVINEAHRTSNHGRETQYEGMRDAFMRCLNKLKNA